MSVRASTEVKSDFTQTLVAPAGAPPSLPPVNGVAGEQSTLKSVSPSDVSFGCIACIKYYASTLFDGLIYLWDLLCNCISETKPVFDLTSYAASDETIPFAVEDYELPAGFDINVSHAALKRRNHAFLDKITSLDSWKDPAVLHEFNELMREAYKELVLLFKDLQQKADNNVEKMAELLEHQHFGDKDFKGPDYCEAFMFNSIIQIYSNARRYWVCEKFKPLENYPELDKQNPGLFDFRDKGEQVDARLSEYSKVFFTPGTPQYEARRLFNATHKLFVRYPGLVDALEIRDTRYRKALAPDVKPGRIPSPG